MPEMHTDAARKNYQISANISILVYFDTDLNNSLDPPDPPDFPRFSGSRVLHQAPLPDFITRSLFLFTDHICFYLFGWLPVRLKLSNGCG
ncbi:hypothetical protein SPLC1_S061290 [Arthrospira platensis C1]|nr:hypothetical protein SPLC1_S061290 [Arthrospira platensis C1]